MDAAVAEQVGDFRQVVYVLANVRFGAVDLRLVQVADDADADGSLEQDVHLRPAYAELRAQIVQRDLVG